MVLDVIFQAFRPILVIWAFFWPFLATFSPKVKINVNWSCNHSKRSQEKQKYIGDGFRWQFQWVQVISGNLVSFWDHQEPFLGPNTKFLQTGLWWHLQNDHKTSGNLIKMVLDVNFKTSRSFRAILCYFVAIGAIFGPKMTLNGLKGPEPIKIAIWNHLQCISASLAVVLSGDMTSLQQFWVWGKNWLKMDKNGRKKAQMIKIGLNAWKMTSKTISIRYLRLLRSFWVVTWPL